MAPVKNLPAHRRTPALSSVASLSPLQSTDTTSLQGDTLSVTSASEPAEVSSSNFFDLVIIGAGPSALAVVSRILEARPAALYTEEEHHYLHWLQKSTGKTTPASAGHKKTVGRRENLQPLSPSGGFGGQAPLRVIKTKASGRGAERVVAGEKTLYGRGSAAPDDQDSQSVLTANQSCPCPGEMRILVIDKIGDGWLSHWKRAFANFEIRHLRSPMFFHPSPADLDSLLAYAQRTGRTQVAESSFIAGPWAAGIDAKSKCDHAPKDGKIGGVRSGGRRGRDRRVKRLGCCADLDEDVDGLSIDDNSALDGERQRASAIDTQPDLVEIPGVVGAERSKHKKCKQRLDPRKYGRIVGATSGAVNERDRKDYFTPSTQLFHDFVCEDVVKHYGLSTAGNWPTTAQALGTGGKQDDKYAANENDDDALEKSDSPALTLKGEVTSMSWGELLVDGHDVTNGFSLGTSDGVQIGAKAVVSAVGPAGQPSIPKALQNGLLAKPSETQVKDTGETPKETAGMEEPTPPKLFGPGWCHSAAIASAAMQFPPKDLIDNARRRSQTLIVVGGGLTSAQICDLAIRRGCFDRVILLMRGHLKVKAFDIGLDWMGRYSNLRKMQFWQEDDAAARLQMIRDARQGGSITLPYAKLMKRYEEQGKLEIMTHSEIEEARWHPGSANDQIGDPQRWLLKIRNTAPPDPRAQAQKAYEEARRRAAEAEEEGDDVGDDANVEETVEDKEGQAPGAYIPDVEADFIVTASAFIPNFATLPFMKQVAQQHPIRHEGGLPLVTEDLQYGELPLFVVGMYSGLQIGPAAGNLGGIREAADRVVSRLQTLISPTEVTTSFGHTSLASADSTIAGLHEDVSVAKERARKSNTRSGQASTVASFPADNATAITSATTSASLSSSDNTHEQAEKSDSACTAGFTHFGFHSLPIEG